MKRQQQPGPIKAMLRVSRRIAILSEWAAALALIGMTIITSWQVFGRYVLNDTPAWSEKSSGILMVYLAFFGASAMIRDDRHLSLSILRDQLPASWRRILQIVILVLIASFGLVMVFYGVEMMEIVRNWTIPALGVSRSLNYFAFPIAGLLTFVLALDRIVRLIVMPDETEPQT